MMTRLDQKYGGHCVGGLHSTGLAALMFESAGSEYQDDAQAALRCLIDDFDWLTWRWSDNTFYNALAVWVLSDVCPEMMPAGVSRFERTAIIAAGSISLLLHQNRDGGWPVLSGIPNSRTYVSAAAIIGICEAWKYLTEYATVMDISVSINNEQYCIGDTMRILVEGPADPDTEYTALAVFDGGRIANIELTTAGNSETRYGSVYIEPGEDITTGACSIFVKAVNETAQSIGVDAASAVIDYRKRIYVNAASDTDQRGTQAQPFKSIQDAVESSGYLSRIIVFGDDELTGQLFYKESGIRRRLHSSPCSIRRIAAVRIENKIPGAT